jgi:hypothetical protein
VLGEDMRVYHAALLDTIFGPEPGPEPGGVSAR